MMFLVGYCIGCVICTIVFIDGDEDDRFIKLTFVVLSPLVMPSMLFYSIILMFTNRRRHGETR